MMQFLMKLYMDMLENKGYPQEDINILADYFCNENRNVVINDLPVIKFSTEDLIILSEHFPNMESVYFGNFLKYLLFTKQYDEIIVILSKMFVTHIGKTTFSSRNVKDFDLIERTFDKFMESIIWTNIPVMKCIDLFFTVIESENGTLISRWKRPVIDYMIDTLIKDEESFYKFIFANFSKYGMRVFDILLARNILSAIPQLTDFWLNNEFEEKRQVKNILKQHFTEVRDYIITKINAKEIQNAKIVELMLIFKNEKDVQTILQDVYLKEKDINIKRQIVENIQLNISHSNVNLAQVKKNCLHYTEPTVFLGKNIKEFPELVLYNNEQVEDNFKIYYLSSYKNLCSPMASFEVNFFKKMFEPKSMNKFSEFIAQLIIKNDANENLDWAFCLIAQNSTPNCALNLIQKFMQDKSNTVNSNKFIKYYIREHSQETLQLFNSLDKKNYDHKMVLDALLKNMVESNLYEAIDLELLRDKMVPDFDIQNRQIKVDNCILTIEPDWSVTIQGNADLSKTALIEKKRLEREIERQAKRLKTAFHCGRLWSMEDWKKYIVQNSLMNCLASTLLWGRYLDNKVVSVFKIENNELVNLASVEHKEENNCMIGVFHKVEFSEPDWIYMFDGSKAPFDQLYIDIYSLHNYNVHCSVVSRFNGFIVNKSFISRMEANDWRLGVENYGKVSSMIKVNKELELLAEINFEPINKSTLKEDITLGELRFYRLDEVIQTGNNWITNKTNSLELSVLKDRYFSDILFEIISSGKKQ